MGFSLVLFGIGWIIGTILTQFMSLIVIKRLLKPAFVMLAVGILILGWGIAFGGWPLFTAWWMSWYPALF